MQDALSGTITRLARKITVPVINPAMTVDSADFSSFDEGEINFDYCTEFIAARETDKDPEDLRQFLPTIGDCVVVVEDDEIVKVHVHTNEPHLALGEGLKYGQLITVKVENMVEQHRQMVADETEAHMGKREYAAPVTRYGFVSVAAGEGVMNLFRELGADNVVGGGQTMNPSTEDILRAIDLTPAEIVFVLPNNKNIIMAGQQAAALSDKQVVVLPTKTIPQGICAMLSFDHDLDLEDNQQAMEAAIEAVKSGSVTYAARDSEFDGRSIQEGDHMALTEGKLLSTGKDFMAVMADLAKEMCKGECNFITIIHGEGADEQQADQVRELFQKASGDAEINVLCGGQPVYSYLISVE
jgi:DAK2 domain fusion protein YloV